MKKALLALALVSASTALLAAPTNPSAVPPVGASVQLATPDARLVAAEAKSEALEDRLIAVEAKGEAAESAYSRFEVITGLLALFITLLVAAFGFFTHRAAVNAVKAETSDLKEQLRKNIEEATQNAKTQREEFERQKGEIAALLAGAGEAARQLSVHKDAAAASAAEISAMLDKMQSAPPGARAADLPPDERAKVETAAKNLEDKPQSEWTLADFKSRIALAALVRKDSAEALRLAEELARAQVHDPEAVAYSLFQQAHAHGELGRPEREIALYSELADLFGSSEVPALQEQVAKALYTKGWTLVTLGRNDDAIAAYDEVQSRFGASDAPALQEPVAKALVNKGAALGTLGRNDDAIAAYDEVLSRYGTSDAPALQEPVVKALYNKGWTLGTLGRNDDAIAAYDEVLSRFGTSDAPELQELVAKALLNKGGTLVTLGRSEDAIAACDEVLSRFETSGAPALQEHVAKALVNKGLALGTLGRSDDAIAAYDAVLSRFGTSDAPALQEPVVKALFNTACAHARAKRVKASIAMLGKWAARIGGVDCQKIVGNAEFDAVRDRPSFKAFLRKHGCG